MTTQWLTGNEGATATLEAPNTLPSKRSKILQLREEIAEAKASIVLNALARQRDQAVLAGHQILGPVGGKRTQTLTESTTNDYWLSAYSEMLNRFSENGVLSYPVSNPTDRRYGHNYPFWYSEVTHGVWRARARLLVTTSANAQGLLNGCTNYTIHKGFTYEIKPRKGIAIHPGLIQQGQQVLDQFDRDNLWTETEREIYKRTRRDGEAFIRFFPQMNGRLQVRIVEPEQILNPPKGDPNWTYGILTEPTDICKTVAFYVDYGAPHQDKEKADPDGFVESSSMLHIKINVDRSIKRGLTDFSFGAADNFEASMKLLKNLGAGSAVQAAIAGIRQHEFADDTAVGDFNVANATYQATNPATQGTDNFQVLDAGSFLDIPKGLNFVTPPGASNAQAHLEVQKALLRTAGAIHNAPEWLCSGDASNNNFASSLTAESPFVRGVEANQQFYVSHFKSVKERAIQNAIDAGKLPRNFLDICEVCVTVPRVQTRNRTEDATVNDVNLRNKTTSPQIVAAEEGRDWDQIRSDWEQYNEEFGPAPGALPTDPMPDNDPEGDNPPEDQDEDPKKPKPPLQEKNLREGKGTKHDSKTGRFTSGGGSAGKKAKPAKKGSKTPPKKPSKKAPKQAPKKGSKKPTKTPPKKGKGKTVKASKKPGLLGRLAKGAAKIVGTLASKAGSLALKGAKAGAKALSNSKLGREVKQSVKDVKNDYRRVKTIVKGKAKKLGLREEAQWRTIGGHRGKATGGKKRGGAKVLISDTGKILKGPGHMVGKKPGQLDVAFGTPGAKKATHEDIKAKAKQLQGKKQGKGELHQMLGTMGHRDLKAFAADNGLRTPVGKKALVRSIAHQLTTEVHGKKAIHRDARAQNVNPKHVESLAREIHSQAMDSHKLETTVRTELAKLHKSYNKSRLPAAKAIAGKDVTAIKSYDVILDGLRKSPETKAFFTGMDRGEAEAKLHEIASSKQGPAPTREQARKDAISQLQDNPDAAYSRKGKQTRAGGSDTPF